MFPLLDNHFIPQETKTMQNLGFNTNLDFFWVDSMLLNTMIFLNLLYLKQVDLLNQRLEERKKKGRLHFGQKKKTVSGTPKNLQQQLQLLIPQHQSEQKGKTDKKEQGSQLSKS